MTANHHRFEGIAEIYDRRRPGFPPEIFAALIARAPQAGPRRAVDVGAGTGLSAQGLLQAGGPGWRVAAVEPGADMRAQLQKRFDGEPRAEIFAAGAEQLPLEDASASILLAARALHWFDQPAFFAEARRVLAPGGVVACLFNRLAPQPALDAAEGVFAAEGLQETRRRGYDAETFGALEAAEGFGPPERVEAPWSVDLDDDGLVGLMFSRARFRSVIERLGEAETRRRLLAAIRAAAPGETRHRLPHHAVLAVSRKSA